MTRSFGMRTLQYPLVFALVITISPSDCLACTTAVISGRATADGRPLLWKNRDTTTKHNEVVILDEGRFEVLAVVNASNRSSVWMGVNEAGLCIENSLSTDLSAGKKRKGIGNGQFMKRALMTCETVEQVRQLLESTNESGRATHANFGVIDARGGAALFETGPDSFVMFDANDPTIAPDGVIVRSNFATTAQGLTPNPEPTQVEPLRSGQRYLRACQLLSGMPREQLTIQYMLKHLTRDLAQANGQPQPGSVNDYEGTLPEVIDTTNTISRTTTVSAVVFHGVRAGEDPLLTTMWTILGDPKFSVAVPCWVSVDQVADCLTDDRGGEIGEIAITVREWYRTADSQGVRSAGLTKIWQTLWPIESESVDEVHQLREQLTKSGIDRDKLTQYHHRLAETAFAGMHAVLMLTKQEAIAAPSRPKPQFNEPPKTIISP